MNATAEKLAEIPHFDEALQFIRGTGVVDKIYVFGSRARGDGKSDSDLDLCVVFTTLDRRPILLMRHLHAMLSKILMMPVDVLVYEKRRFQERFEAGARFEQTVVAEGIVL